MDYEIQDVPEATYAVIERTVAFSEVPAVMPGLMDKVHSWAETVPHGVHMCISSTTDDGRPPGRSPDSVRRERLPHGAEVREMRLVPAQLADQIRDRRSRAACVDRRFGRT